MAFDADRYGSAAFTTQQYITKKEHVQAADSTNNNSLYWTLQPLVHVHIHLLPNEPDGFSSTTSAYRSSETRERRSVRHGVSQAPPLHSTNNTIESYGSSVSTHSSKSMPTTQKCTLHPHKNTYIKQQSFGTSSRRHVCVLYAR